MYVIAASNNNNNNNNNNTNNKSDRESDNSNGDHASVSSVADFDVNTSSHVPTNSSDSNGVSLAADPTPLDNFVDCDSLMRKPYGATLIQSGSCSHSDWH